MLIFLCFTRKIFRERSLDFQFKKACIDVESIRIFKVESVEYEAALLDPNEEDIVRASAYVKDGTFEKTLVLSNKKAVRDFALLQISNNVKPSKLKYGFCKDIKYTMGHPARSWLNSIFVGRGANTEFIKSQIIKASATEDNILLLGATGSGKNLISYCIHTLSQRRNNVYQQYNIGQSTKELVNSELFGSRKGSFTGSIKQEGLLKRAANGTILIDEICNISLSTQNKLLEFCEKKQFHIPGSDVKQKTKSRLVCASNMDAKLFLKNCNLKKDLLARIAEFTLFVPHLVNRKSDFVDIINILSLRYKVYNRIDEFGLDGILFHLWDGNIRQVKNFVLELNQQCLEEIAT